MHPTLGEIGLFGRTEGNFLLALGLACGEFSVGRGKIFAVAEIGLGVIHVAAWFPGEF